ncbi:hypothetical protein D9V37_11600 [Nocardioides mangrovicus]|uniref:Uncharacterized protein n=1 Tax=Nocardioides mangrovicus TaxID=2478913 RepID=A0A3L8P2W7_9ACTN|nr:hypothetical protein [Nocardioides mangrovicus]RLV49193.1 hypothetical protein D9V37_11600 [Nocardioides mangrovicus]
MIATTGITERPRDAELDAPVPYACEFDDGRASVRLLNKKRVTQCALSRICGVCGDTLGNPVAFVGPLAELQRAAFHFPAVHEWCGETLVRACGRAGFGVLGQDHPVADWVMVTTGGYDHDRAQAEDPDQRPTFRPNSVVDVKEL